MFEGEKNWRDRRHLEFFKILIFPRGLVVNVRIYLQDAWISFHLGRSHQQPQLVHHRNLNVQALLLTL
jgi:hypothetical protein